MEDTIVYFEGGGRQCTDEALKIAKEYAKKNEIRNIIVASTTGFTAEKAAEAFSDKNLVVVTHVYGFREKNKTEFPFELRKNLESKGIKVLTSAHGFGGVNKLVESSLGNVVADTLRMFSQGIKVAVEIAVQAADAGLIRTDEDVISIAGTGKGADTVLVIRPANSHCLFETKVRKVLAMPI